MIAVVAAARFDIFVASLREARTLVAIIVASALIGALSSLLNGADMALVGRQLIEVHVQAIVGTIVGVAVRRTCGAQAIMYAFAIAVGLSAAVAASQFLDVRAAWEARRFLGSFQEEGLRIEGFASGARARGLSYSAVLLGTQLCLLFAAIFAYRWRSAREDYFSKADRWLLLMLVPLAGAAVASGNRSPLLGMLVFAFFYLWLVQRRSTIMLVGIAVFFFPLILALPEALRGLDLRIGETEDGSAVGRFVLQYYGLLLFLARPIGYGLTFDSTEHWTEFWTYVKDFDNANAVTAYALHNYFLMMINKYGFPILLVAGAVAWKLGRHKWALLGFVPYLVQIFFHNDGPLMADFLIWYIIPMYAGLSRSSEPRGAEVLPPGAVARWATGPQARMRGRTQGSAAGMPARIHARGS
ncbi:MAG: O-antigen ligase family protein [Rhodospirillales bacterium]|nr:O-antigen ligase family protein [Rhodospirillales bacterium]